MDSGFIVPVLLAAIIAILFFILRVLMWSYEFWKSWEFQLIEVRKELERIRFAAAHKEDNEL